jgi:hypothetical protein
MRSLTPLRLIIATSAILVVISLDRVRAESTDLMSLEVGAATRLEPAKGIGAAAAGSWSSSDPHVAQVFQNGYVVALRPGAARVRAGERQWNVNVAAPPPQQLVDPKTLRQYDDNRHFDVDGRRCYGSELNGSRYTDPDEHRNLKSNRVINPHPADKDHELEWPVRGQTTVYDGAGVLMGTVAPTLRVDGRAVPASKFNFGMSKVLDGRLCLYAFSVTIKPTPDVLRLADADAKKNGVVGTSAWLPLDCVIDAESLLERIGVGKVRLPALPLEDTRYRITGGDPARYVTPTGELSIVKQVAEGGPVPSHYLRRPSGTVNLIYSVPGFGLGGQGLDSFLVTDNATFRPAKGAKVFVQPTYYPARDPKAGEVAKPTMTFLYGAVEVNGAEPVYGWIAKEALAEAK